MIKAIIFDLDGVIVDSEAAHMAAFAKVLGEFDISFTKWDVDNTFGIGAYNVFSRKFAEHGINPPRDIMYYVDRKDSYYREIFSQDFRPIPGVVDFIKKAGSYFRLCIASSTSRDNIGFALERMGIRDCFEFYLSRNDVTETKPSPEIYRQAISMLKLAPDECVVIEDTNIGIAAAKGAGAHVIALTTTFPRQSIHGADLILKGYDQLNVETVIGLSN